MTTLIMWPESEVKDVLSGILTVVGRSFTINVKQTGIPCPLCLAGGYLDPVTNTSTNSFCSICYGAYYINNISAISMSGHVRWINSEIPRWQSGGIIPDGDCKITVAFTDEIRANIENADTFEVDNKILSLKSYTIKGAKSPNRIIITLKEESNNRLNPVSTGPFVVGTSYVGVNRIS